MLKHCSHGLLFIGLASAVGWASAQSAQVRSLVDGSYISDHTITDAAGNVFSKGTYVYGWEQSEQLGHDPLALPPAAGFAATWDGDASKGMTPVDAAARAYTTWGGNHASGSTRNFTPVSYSVPCCMPLVGYTDTGTNFTHANAFSSWQEVLYVGGGSGTGHFDSSFHIDGTLGPTIVAGSPTSFGTVRMNWQLSTDTGQTVVEMNAMYSADFNIWTKLVFSGGVRSFSMGSGPLAINEDLLGGFDFTYDQAFSLKSDLLVQADGNNDANFDDTVKMTRLLLPQDSAVYLASGASAAGYGLAFGGDGSGTVCATLSCATGGLPPVPEPRTWALMLLGLAALGFTGRQGRQGRQARQARHV